MAGEKILPAMGLAMVLLSSPPGTASKLGGKSQNLIPNGSDDHGDADLGRWRRRLMWRLITPLHLQKALETMCDGYIDDIVVIL